MLTVREDRDCWMPLGVERYDPLWPLLTGSAEGRRKSFRLSVINVYAMSVDHKLYHMSFALEF